MTSFPPPEKRVRPPLRADEGTTLREFLDYHRETFRWKCAGLTRQQLVRPLPPSQMTLGGMMKHLAVVESSWFEEDFAGRGLMPPFNTVDWDADRDWEWHTARDDEPEQLLALFDDACRRADAVLDGALAEVPLSLRWILVHMIEEYARHNGHADLIREAIDGQTGQ